MFCEKKENCCRLLTGKGEGTTRDGCLLNKESVSWKGKREGGGEITIRKGGRLLGRKEPTLRGETFFFGGGRKPRGLPRLKVREKPDISEKKGVNCYLVLGEKGSAFRVHCAHREIWKAWFPFKGPSLTNQKEECSEF